MRDRAAAIREEHAICLRLMIPGDSYVVPFWVVYDNHQLRKRVMTKKKLERSLQVLLVIYILHDPISAILPWFLGI